MLRGAADGKDSGSKYLGGARGGGRGGEGLEEGGGEELEEGGGEELEEGGGEGRS